MSAASLSTVEQALDEAARRRSSPAWFAVVTVVIAGLWFLPAHQFETPLRALLVSWWACTAALAITTHFERRQASRVLEIVGEIAAAVASVAAIFASGTLTTPVWLVTFGRAFTWWPRRRSTVLAARWATIASHLALAAAWVAQGHPSGAVIVLALLVGQIVILEVSSQLLRQRLALEAEGAALHDALEEVQVRREADRIAREVHDGLGADLVALNLSLRAKGPTATAHQEQVLALLEELRTVVWSLRGGRGSLAEFEKVLRARLRTALPPSVEVSSECRSHRGSAIAPEAALALLSAIHGVATKAAREPSLTAVKVELRADARLELVVRLETLPPDQLASLAQAGLATVDGSVSPEVTPLADGSGVLLGVPR